MKKKIFVPILTLTLTGILVFSGYQIYKIISEYESGERTYDDLEIYVSTPSITSTPQNSSESEKKTENAWPEVDFEGLAAINPDIVGWIYSEDTPINYPIVQGTDNSYYLKHLYTGEFGLFRSPYYCLWASYAEWLDVLFSNRLQTAGIL